MLIKKFTETNINESFAPLIDNLIDQYTEQTRRLAARYLEEAGTEHFQYPYYVRGGYTQKDLDQLARWDQINRSLTSHKREVYSTDAPTYYLDEEKLAKNADDWAHMQVDGMIAKTVSKIGDLDECHLTFHGGGDFQIKGKSWCGARVHVEQQTVIKRSKKGTIFAQFPMRIWVNGKFNSAKAYAEKWAKQDEA